MEENNVKIKEAEEKEKCPIEQEQERKAHALELIVVILLGVTALLTAWASWIGSLHGGNQAENFAQSNNLSAEGNYMYNEAMQFMLQDMLLYNELMNVLIDMHFAEAQGDELTYERLTWRFEQLETNMSYEFEAAFWASFEDGASPFTNPDFVDSYVADALYVLAEAEELFEQAGIYGGVSDSFGLVTVFFTVALFLFGVASTFKKRRNKLIVIGIASGAFVIALAFMLFLPLPTDFSLTQFFGN